MGRTEALTLHQGSPGAWPGGEEWGGAAAVAVSVAVSVAVEVEVEVETNSHYRCEGKFTRWGRFTLRRRVEPPSRRVRGSSYGNRVASKPSPSAPPAVFLRVSSGDLHVLEEALDSHVYWQLSDLNYRRDGYVFPPGSDDPKVRSLIAAAEKLMARVRRAQREAARGRHSSRRRR